MLRADHEIMISQGDSWASVKLRDKTEDTGKSSGGSWVPKTNRTSDDSEISFTSAAPEHLMYAWSSDPGTLVMGEIWDQSKSSHKEGEGVFTSEFITLYKVKRSAAGKFSGEGDGVLRYGVGSLFKAGGITWAVNRYERA